MDDGTTVDLAALRRSLLGAWTLVRWQIVAVAADGHEKASEPFGAGATGLIVYTEDGWMNACIARASRARLSADSVRQAPVAEQCAAFESYFSYAGPFRLQTLDGAPHVVHEVRWSLNPNFVGTQQVRRVTFDGAARLTLSADEPLPGGRLRRHRLDWQRP